MAEKKQDGIIIKLKQGIAGICISFLGIGSMLISITVMGKYLMRCIRYGGEIRYSWNTEVAIASGLLFFLFLLGVVIFISFPYSIEVRKENLLLKYPFFRITIPNEIVKRVVVKESFVDWWYENFILPDCFSNIFLGTDIYVVLSKRKFFLKTIYLRYEWTVDRGEFCLLDELVRFYERLNQERNSGD